MSPPVPARLDLPEVDLSRGWLSLLQKAGVFGRASLPRSLHTFLEQSVLPAVLPCQRWFAAKGKPLDRVTLHEHACWSEQDDDWLLLWLNTEFRDGESQVYFLPISLAPAKPDSADLPTAWGIITGGTQTTFLYDAFTDPAFCQVLVRAMGKQREISIGDARLMFLATSAFPDPCQGCSDISKIDRLLAQGTNTVVRLNDLLFLKGVPPDP